MSPRSSKQHSIKNSINVTGIGLHSGQPVKLTLLPAPINTGIVFRRKDLKPNVKIKLDVNKIVETPLCTKLVAEGIAIQTVEHLLSALAGLEIDNIYVDLNANELPIMDGSSAPFVFMLEAAGIKEQNAPRKLIKVTKTIRVEEGDKFVEFAPADRLHINLSIDFPHPKIQATCQKISFAFSRSAYTKEISRARTFGMADQLKALHQQGLALGASLDNAVGLSEDGILNPEGLRVRDEFVKHKTLDAIGDLYTMGAIQACYSAHKPSHALNNRLLKALLEDKEAWVLVQGQIEN